ncbi:MAG: hypothetical protein IPM96_11390 [Ignavibacteria bacterium]|nr:hypothetical protein [Ignavibacteria bacterium]
MNAAHLHLVLNHIPVIGSMFAIFILIIGILKKSDDVKKVCMLVIILTSLITIPVYLTGEDAEEKIEGNYEDVDEEFIEPHEDFALYSFIAMNITGAVALLSMFLFKKPKVLPNSFAYLMLAILLIVNGMMAYTAYLGGKIHHPEIREDKLPWESSVITNGSTNKSELNSGDKKEADKNEKDEERKKDKEDDD